MNSANAAWQASVGSQSMALSGGVPAPSGLTQASAIGLGGAVGRAGIGSLLAVLLALGSGVPALGCSDGADDAFRRARRRFSGRRAGRSVGRGGLRGDLLGRLHGTEPQHRRLADQPDELVLLDVGHGDDDLLVAGGDDLGLADAEAVHPVLDDRLGELQAGGIDGTGAGGVLRRST